MWPSCALSECPLWADPEMGVQSSRTQWLISAISGGCSVVTVCLVIAVYSVGMAEMTLLPGSCPIPVLHLLSCVTSSPTVGELQFPVNNAIMTCFRWQLESKRLLYNTVLVLGVFFKDLMLASCSSVNKCIFSFRSNRNRINFERIEDL